jgi:hypothetical protein
MTDAQRVQALRDFVKQQDRSMASVARLLGYTPGYLDRVLHGDRPWTEELLKRLREVLSLDLR